MNIKELKITTDCGGVLIGNEQFKTIVPNGYGDCRQTFIIGDYIDEKINNIVDEYDLKYWSRIEGENINLYDDDGKTILETLEKGAYAVYYGSRTIIFAKC